MPKSLDCPIRGLAEPAAPLLAFPHACAAEISVWMKIGIDVWCGAWAGGTQPPFAGYLNRFAGKKYCNECRTCIRPVTRLRGLIVWVSGNAANDANTEYYLADGADSDLTANASVKGAFPNRDFSGDRGVTVSCSIVLSGPLFMGGSESKPKKRGKRKGVRFPLIASGTRDGKMCVSAARRRQVNPRWVSPGRLSVRGSLVPVGPRCP